MTKIHFEVWGLSLMEPMSLILNWLICILAFSYFFKLNNQPNSDFVRYWRWFFFLFGLSTFFGGLSHFFFHYLGMPGKIPGWACSLFAISSIQYSILTNASEQVSARLRYVIFIQFFVVCTVLFLDFRFLWVTIHTAIGLILFLGIWSVRGVMYGQKSLKYFLIGIMLLVCTLPFMILGIDPHLWFNRQDASHILMLGTLYCFHTGVQKTNPALAKHALVAS